MLGARAGAGGSLSLHRKVFASVSAWLLYRRTIVVEMVVLELGCIGGRRDRVVNSMFWSKYTLGVSMSLLQAGLELKESRINGRVLQNIAGCSLRRSLCCPVALRHPIALRCPIEFCCPIEFRHTVALHSPIEFP